MICKSLNILHSVPTFFGNVVHVTVDKFMKFFLFIIIINCLATVKLLKYRVTDNPVFVYLFCFFNPNPCLCLF